MPSPTKCVLLNLLKSVLFRPFFYVPKYYFIVCSLLFYCILPNSRYLSLFLCEFVWKCITFWLSCTATGPKLRSFVNTSLLKNPLYSPSFSLSLSPPSAAVSLRQRLHFLIKRCFLGMTANHQQYFLSPFECAAVSHI